MQWIHEKETVDTIASTLNLKNRKDVVNKVEALKEELKEAKVEVEQLSAKLNAIQAAQKQMILKKSMELKFFMLKNN